MARGSIHRRCKVCRKNGKSGRRKCKHKEAVYQIIYYVGRKQKSETVGPNKKDAEKLLAQRISEINNGTYLKPKEITFEEFAHIWLEKYATTRVRPRTLDTYESTIRRYLTPVFGKYLLTQITQEDIQGAMAKLLKKRMPKTVNNVLKLAKTIFKYARRWKYISENPAIDIDNFREQHKEMDFLNPEEIQKLLKHSREPYKTLFLTAILTGMRKSEILALQWGDIDWNGNTIFVRRTIRWKTRKDIGKDEQRWEFEDPKSRYSKRAIVMSPKLKEALEKHRLNEINKGSDFVFTNKVGNPIEHRNFIRREFDVALSCAGLRKIRFHDLRHTFSSLLIDQGENSKFIQSQLGHASIQTTIDRYGHLMPINYQGVGSRLDEKVFGEKVNILEEQKIDI